MASSEGCGARSCWEGGWERRTERSVPTPRGGRDGGRDGGAERKGAHLRSEIHLHVFLVEACESVEGRSVRDQEVRATKAEMRGLGSRDEAFLVRTEALAPGGGLRRAEGHDVVQIPIE